MNEHSISVIPPPAPQVGRNSRTACGLVAILVCVFASNFGIHNFMLGYKGKAIAQLVITIANHALFWTVGTIFNIVTLGFGYFITLPLYLLIWAAVDIWGIVEGIMIFSNKDFRDADGNLLKD
ncbi:MAG: NINE protein [Defluviitaleaceae bacterium]|nr:NINE protein [Defluviitaleaceae bacterium]